MAAFDPTKSFSDNLANVAGADWYHKVAKTMGGDSSDPWNEAIRGLNVEYQGSEENGYKGFDRNDPAAAEAWSEKVRKLTGTAASPAMPSGQGGVTGGGSMAAADKFKAPTNLPTGFDKLAADSQYQASTGNYDESKGVAGRVSDITSAGGALMTAARTRAKQAAAKGGLLNSSLAGQAGEQAVIETAAPMATADAQLYQNQQLANQNALNSASQANAQLRTQVGLAGLNLGENARQFDGTLMEQRRQFDTTSGINQSQFAQNLALERDNLAAQREQFAQKLGLDQASLQLNRDQLSQQDRQFLAELDAKDKQLAQQESQFTRGEQTKVTLAGMDAASREKLLALEASYKKDISGNENISGAWATMMESVDRIQNNPDLDASTKRTMIQNAQAGFQSFTNFWKKANGGATDVSDLLNFGPGGAVAPQSPAAGPGNHYGPGGRPGDGWSENPNGSWDYIDPSSGQ